MAKSRKQKNKKIYDELEVELRNNKENNYENKLKIIDPNLNAKGEADVEERSSAIVKRNEHKNDSALTVIAKKVNGEKKVKKNEIAIVKKEKKENKKSDDVEIIAEEAFNEPISYTDKLSIEEILRAKLEQQEKLKSDKKGFKKGPNNDNYTPKMMQERIKQHVGVDVRKEVKLKHKDYKWIALIVLILALIIVLVLGVLMIFEVI